MYTHTIPTLPKNTNQLHCFLQRATWLTIQTTPSAWRQRGVRELQRKSVAKQTEISARLSASHQCTAITTDREKTQNGDTT